MKRPTLRPNIRRPGPPPGNLFAGIVRLAFFNPTGFAVIGNSTQAFLSSLSPLIALLIVGSALEALTAGWQMGALYALSDICVILGVPVLSQLIARWWKRDRFWLRYATAVNWCLLALPLIGSVFIFAGLFFAAGGPSPRTLAYGLFVAVGLYAFALNVFVARHGLDIAFWRAALLVIMVYAGLGAALTVIPAIGETVATAIHGPPKIVT